MEPITLSYELRSYLSSEENNLIDEGIHLLEEASDETKQFRDFSFVVFPFAKAYEGFLKHLFVDMGFISEVDFRSKYFRIGKVMSPNMVRKLRNRSVYQKICDKSGCELADVIWRAWKEGRNEIFHYYVGEARPLKLHEAREKVLQLIGAMEKTLQQLHVGTVQRKLQDLMSNTGYSASLN